ncbi:hypothetical protein CP966_03650 [Streptomyces galilaeus]|nr:hypothetical protein CP966_03650 [Streptomyces galilaeus]GGW60185.1 hypothetical protein GCM10010350_50940 [Streptomyces galilaeus]
MAEAGELPQNTGHEMPDHHLLAHRGILLVGTALGGAAGCTPPKGCGVRDFGAARLRRQPIAYDLTPFAGIRDDGHPSRMEAYTGSMTPTRARQHQPGLGDAYTGDAGVTVNVPRDQRHAVGATGERYWLSGSSGCCGGALTTVRGR